MKALGKQVTLDLYNCKDLMLNDKEQLKQIIADAAAQYDLQKCFEHIHYDNTSDFIIVSLFVGGHIMAHVYPSQGFIAVDIFSTSANPEKAALYIKQKIAPEKSKLTFLDRGDFGTISDMKPRRKNYSTSIKKVKSAGAKMMKFISQ